MTPATDAGTDAATDTDADAGSGTGARTGVGAARGAISIVPVAGLGEVAAGDDLAALLVDALAADPLRDGDVLVVSSKVVSKAEGRTVRATERDEAITAETVRLVAARRTPHGLARIVQAAAGPVMAAAGVDASNVAPGTVLLLPADPDASARALHARLAELTGMRLGVILSDTAGRAWRDGQTDFALGAAGVVVTEDLRGVTDTHGQVLEVTVRAVADELAAAADLVKGKLTGIPAAVIRNAGAWVTSRADGPGASSLLRTAREDWFRLGHVEAVAASLGLDPAAVEPPAVPPATVADRLRRAVTLALAAPSPWGPPLTADTTFAGATATIAGDLNSVELGALAQRLLATAWAEDLAVDVGFKGERLMVWAEDLPR